MLEHHLSDAQLVELAGKAAFDRGRGYYARGLVVLQKASADALVGEAHGTETYGLWMKRGKLDWDWECDCPAAEGGTFCKHLVAAVLTARDETGESDGVGTGSGHLASAARKDELLVFLRAQPAERLADWLHAFANEDGDVEKRLLLYRAAEQPGALKAALAKLLNTGGFLDYRRAMSYAQRLDAGIEQLRELLLRDPDECRELCDYALGRLFKIYGNADDSAGAIGECLGAMAELHAQSCAAAPPGKALAKRLLALQDKDDWGVLELASYWDALGSLGQAEYGRRIQAEFARLPEPKQGEHFGEGYEICRRVEAFARCADDFALLQRVLRRDLSNAYQHLRVLESLREFGRTREAMAWAEAAVKRFPNEQRLRLLLAECLAEAGMDEEALEQAWLSFLSGFDCSGWDALKQRAGAAWPAWRQRALDEMASREKNHATARVGMLLHDGDTASAMLLARDHTVQPGVLQELAQRLHRSEPDTAGAFYLRLARDQMESLGSASGYARLVGYLKDASKLLAAEEWQPLLETVRAQHARKTKLLGLLTQAGL
jgi:uncharacterized Zn finger protein